HPPTLMGAAMRIPYPKFLIAALLAGVASASAAQAPTTSTTASAGWSAWLGCWTPAGAAVDGQPALTTCVVPGDAPLSVEIVSLAGDSIAMRSTMTADGVARPVTGEGCAGTETARFSDDGARVYVSGEITCGAGPAQRTSG